RALLQHLHHDRRMTGMDGPNVAITANPIVAGSIDVGSHGAPSVPGCNTWVAPVAWHGPRRPGRDPSARTPPPGNLTKNRKVRATSVIHLRAATDPPSPETGFKPGPAGHR